MESTNEKKINIVELPKCCEVNVPQQPESVSKRSENENVLERQSGLVSDINDRNVPDTEESPEATMGTTSFIDDAIVDIQEESHMSMVNSRYLEMNDSQQGGESMESFLARPIKLGGGTFTTADTITTFTDYLFPNEVFGSTFADIWTDKLKGYYGIRCDFRIKIVFNSNRFQQGRYMLCWLPLCGSFKDSLNGRLVNRLNMMQHTLVQRTTLRHVEFDINSGTSAELVIPYASVDTFFPISSIISGTYDRWLGLLTLCPYSPLVTPSGSTVVPYTLYVSLENVRLFGAVEPQSGLTETKGKGPSEKESAIPNGPVSGVAKRFANAFDALSGVPLIGNYALGASWIADRVSQTAAIFGFSKPNQGDCVNKVLVINHPNHCNVDGDSAAKPLSFLSKPATLPVVGASGTEVDQMDFSYLKSIYAWHTSHSWSTLGLEGTTIAAYSVTPFHWYVSSDGHRNYLPMAFLASHFNAWRGSMKFRFKFVKTEFHSGRLSFEFVPTNNPLTPAPTNPSYVNRQIVDIREIDEVEVIVPYINTTPWAHPTEIIGRLFIRIVDPLVAPASVSSTISLLVEMAGGNDLEFAIPSAQCLTPMRVLDRQSGITSSRKVSFTVGNTNVTGDDITFSSTTIGDKVSSLRSYLKRYGSMAPVGDTYSLNLPLMIVQPDVIFVPPVTLTAGTAWGTADLLGKWALCYGMWSGGIRLKDVVNPSLFSVKEGTFKVTTFGRNHTDLGTMPNLLTSINYVANRVSDHNHSILQQYNVTNSSIEVEIPQYTISIARAVNDCIAYENAVLDPQKPRLESMTQVFLHFGMPRNGTTNGVTADSHLHNLFRAGADDLNLSVFVAIPPVSVSDVYVPNNQYCI